ncbi:MAG: DUF5996 family protein [Pseudomonadota bacterium]|nr:DUF5996 family protein [Pseudomonadota bacterium]
MSASSAGRHAAWPALPYDQWKDTRATLHLWSQIVGKIRLTQSPWINHAWHATFYLTARGITTSPIAHGARTVELAFDFIDHVLRIETSDGESRIMALKPRPVAQFYDELMAHMTELGLPVHIHVTPNELIDAIPFPQDHVHAAYDAEAANRYWRLLLQAERVFTEFRSRFIGKCSPVHLFWGSFDLAVSRFSGAPAPEHPGGAPHCPDWVTRDAYSHEVSSCGFWPGNDAMPYPLFYAYAYPEPAGFSGAQLRPAAAFYDSGFGEFVLPYEEVRMAPDPDGMLLDFLQSAYEAAADLGKWPRAQLERAGIVLRR